MERDVGSASDPWWVVLVATAGLTLTLLMAADLYVELIAAGVAYAAAGVLVHYGTHSANQEATE